MQIMVELTPEQEVQKSYDAAMDSVNLLNAGQPKDMTDAEWQDCKQRNIDHLKIQIAKGEYYAGFDLKPFQDAVA
jgi:anti-sigma28 factor (negative regulator of flagellin synthesis)